MHTMTIKSDEHEWPNALEYLDIVEKQLHRLGYVVGNIDHKRHRFTIETKEEFDRKLTELVDELHKMTVQKL